MYCRDCGSKLDDGSLFCSECGGRQDPPEQSSGQVVSPAPGPIFAAPPTPVRAAAAAPTSPVIGGGNVFLDKVLGLLFVGLALIGSLLALVSQILPPARISVVSLGSVLTGSMPIILMTVLAATISWRAHGMDWSIAGFALLPYLFTSLTNDLVKLRRTSGTLKNGNWLRTDTGADSRVSNEAVGGCRTLQYIRQLTFA